MKMKTVGKLRIAERFKQVVRCGQHMLVVSLSQLVTWWHQKGLDRPKQVSSYIS